MHILDLIRKGKWRFFLINPEMQFSPDLYPLENDERIFGRPFFGRPFGFGFGFGGLLAGSLLSPYGYGGYSYGYPYGGYGGYC